jgi:hypothetical protein
VGHPETADATDRHSVVATGNHDGHARFGTPGNSHARFGTPGNIPTPPKAAVRFCNFDCLNELESNATSLPTYLPLFFTYCQRMAQTLPVYLTKTRKIHSLGGVVQP